MILGFKPQFKEPILSGTKIHTIRADEKNRWRIGRIIHFATGVRTKNYEQFHEDACKYIQDIEISVVEKGSVAIRMVYVDGRCLRGDEIYGLARNDGFKSANSFFEWFKDGFTGKIIHWTDFKY